MTVVAVLLLLSSAGWSASLGSRFSMGTDSYAAASDFLGGVRLKLDAELFHLTDRRLLKLLKAAAGRGAEVRLILDPGQSRNRQAQKLVGSDRVQVRWMVTDASRGQLMHVKAACADGQRLLIGSPNWTHSGMSLNREALVVLDDPGVARDFETAFERDWAAASERWPRRRVQDEEVQGLPDPAQFYDETPHFHKKRHPA
jgi:phosphatidylserine/phosphatidylglycerophosphate/cardiolipin synthase-like enzyme